MELIIGRESGVENPRLAIQNDGKMFYYGKPGSVPKTVSRNHCRVVINQEGKMLIEDITDNNFMYISGQDCKRKNNVSMGDIIELGPDRYRLDMESIVKTLTSQQSFCIVNLKEVYETYQKERFDLQVSQGKLNALSALPGVLSMASIGLAFFFSSNARVWMIVIAALFALIFALIRYRNATRVPVKTKAIEDSFREKYICPNPMCGHFLGFTPYKEIIKNRSCPYCRSRFTG